MQNLGLATLCLAVPAYYWLGSFHTPVGGLPPGPLALAVTLFLSILLVFCHPDLRVNRAIVALMMVSTLATYLSVVALLAQGASLEQVIDTIVSTQGVGLGIALCSYLLVTSPQRFGIFLGTLLFAITASAAVGIGQFAIGDPFFRLWEASGDLPSERVVQGVLGGQVAGLALYSVPLGYQLASTIPIVLALLLARGAVSRKYRLLLWGVLLILMAGLLFTGIRTALVGVAVSFVLIAFLGRRWRFRPQRLFPALLIGGIVLVAAGGQHPQNLDRLFKLSDLSAQSKLPLALEGIHVALERPLFGGKLDYSAVASTSSIRPSLPDDLQQLVAGNTSHNHFINVAAFYGIPVLILVLLFYFLLVHTLIRAPMKNDSFPVAMRIGLLASLTAYTIVSLTHNAGPFVGDPRFWFIIGLIFSLVRVWSPMTNRAPELTRAVLEHAR